MHLILIRHGEPDIHADDLSDPPLTPLGHRQAAATASYLEGAAIDAIYVSPQLRARQTCEPLATSHSLIPTVDERIAEWDYEYGTYVPPWANDKMTREEAIARFDEMQTPAFHARVKAGFDDIVADNPSRTCAVVCHGGVIASVVADVLQASRRAMSASHAGITRIAANQKGTRTVLTFNEHDWVPST